MEGRAGLRFARAPLTHRAATLTAEGIERSGAALMAGRASGVLEGRGASVSGLREHNLSTVMQVLAAAPAELPRALVAERAGLGMSALTKIVAELERRRLVAEYEDANPAGMGRPVQAA